MLEKKKLDVSSALNYLFEKKKKELYYFDARENEITRVKENNHLYLDNNNYPFTSGKYHKVALGDGTDNFIKVLDMGLSVNEGSLMYHNRISKIIFSKYKK